jgi:hypothetical protein
MRDDICTIPVSEGFEPKDGCPLCRMRAIAERRVISYIMGAAMMEPDVRVRTNELGFCSDHYAMMQKSGNRLSLALMLDSHLAEVGEDILGEGKKIFKQSDKKCAYKAVELGHTCFVCDKMNYGMEHMLDTIYRVYEKEPSFQVLFSEQTELCLPHYPMLVQNVPDRMDKKSAARLRDAARKLVTDYVDELKGDVRHFCDMFDYRNNDEDADWGNSRDSIERAIAFLNGDLPEEKKKKIK